MSRTELPITQMEMQDVVDRYGPTATLIGINQVRTGRMNGFIDTYMGDNTEDLYATIDGEEHRYPQKFISGVTVRGDMFHTRLHDAPHTVDKSIRCLTVIDSVYGDDPAEYWAAESEKHEPGYNLIHRTDITASRLVGYGPGLRSVDLDDDEDELEVKSPAMQHLELALARLSLPQIRFGNANWDFRTGIENYEAFHDVLEVQLKVAMLRQELGVAAASRVVVVPQFELQPTGSDQ